MMKIFKIILLITILACPAYATEFAKIEYSGIPADYSKINQEALLRQARFEMNKWLYSKDVNTRNKYKQAALGDYFLLTKVNSKLVAPYINLGRIYDEMKMDTRAKGNFYAATNIEPENPYANFYFGEFYFKRGDYKRALQRYNVAYKNGFSKSFELTYHMAICYEKLSDLRKARIYYMRAKSINPADENSAKKIHTLDDFFLEHQKYYNFSGDLK